MYSPCLNAEYTFDDFLASIITEQSEALAGRIGQSTYDTFLQPAASYIKRAEKCFVAAEMVQRRINIILGNVVGAGQEIDTRNERAQRKAYLDEAEAWLSNISSADYSGGVIITEHAVIPGGLCSI